RLASGSDDSTVRVWDVRTGREVLRLQAPKGAVCWGVTFSPDGTRLAANTRGGVTIWDALTGRVVGAFRGCAVGSGVCGAPFPPDGKRPRGGRGGGAGAAGDAPTRRGGVD